MSQRTPSDISPTPDEPVYASAADEFAAIELVDEPTDEDDDDETEGEGGKGDSRGRKGLKEYEVKIDRALLDFSAEEGLEPLAAVLDILRKLKLAAPSEIIRGGSVVGPEHADLTLRELGLLTQKLTPKNVADPDIFKKLDAAQRELRSREGIPHPDDILNGEGGGRSEASAAVRGLIDTTMADDNKANDKNKGERGQEDDDDPDYDRDSSETGYRAEPSVTDELMTPRPETDMSDLVDLFDDDLPFDRPDNSFSSTMDLKDMGQVASGQMTFDTLVELFNAVVTATEAPVERVALRDDLHLQAPGRSGQHFDI